LPLCLGPTIATTEYCFEYRLIIVSRLRFIIGQI